QRLAEVERTATAASPAPAAVAETDRQRAGFRWTSGQAYGPGPEGAGAALSNEGSPPRAATCRWARSVAVLTTLRPLPPNRRQGQAGRPALRSPGLRPG